MAENGIIGEVTLRCCQCRLRRRCLPAKGCLLPLYGIHGHLLKKERAEKRGALPCLLCFYASLDVRFSTASDRASSKEG